MATRRVLDPRDRAAPARGGDRPARTVILNAGDDGELGLGDNPLEDVGGDDPLVSEFYTSTLPTLVEPSPPTVVESQTPPQVERPVAVRPSPPKPPPPPTAAATTPKQRVSRSKGRQPLPDGRTFRLVTFSFYEDDVARLDALLKVARQKGHRRASRSQIVRQALRQIDLDTLPDDQ